MLMKLSAESDKRRHGCVCVLAALFFLPAFGCTDDGSGDGDLNLTLTPGDGDGDGDTDDGDTGDGDTDDPGDGDGDPTGDGDGDDTGDGDGDDTGDGDGDPTATGNCGPYPSGPYNWYDNNVVPPETTLPAMYGPDGVETTLNMSDVHDNCEEVKALVFAFGAND